MAGRLFYGVRYRARGGHIVVVAPNARRRTIRGEPGYYIDVVPAAGEYGAPDDKSIGFRWAEPVASLVREDDWRGEDPA